MNKYINELRKRIVLKTAVRSVKIPPTVKQVSFTFDDVPESAFVNAQPILERYGYRGTFYVALSFLDTDKTNINLYHKNHLSACLDNGHELGCHTYSHNRTYQNSKADFLTNDIHKNTVKLNETGIKYKFQNFSYPFGEQTIKMRTIAAKRFESSRGTDHGINKQHIDLNNLKAVKLYQNEHPLDKILSILDQLNSSGGWLIFYTHDVQTEFSKFGCSVEYFEAIVQKCKALNIEVKTVKQAVDELKRLT